MVMLVMRGANARARLARAVLGVGGGRLQNCIVQDMYQEPKQNKQLDKKKLIPKSSPSRRRYAQTLISHPRGNNKKPKLSLEMPRGPRYETCINKRIHYRDMEEKMETKNAPISCPRPFPKVGI